MLSRSALFNFIEGTIWLIVAVIDHVENPIFVGKIFWPTIICGAMGIYLYVCAIILVIKKRQQEKKKSNEI